MKLNIGITKLTPGWEILLQQIGIPFVILNDDTTKYYDLPVIVLSSKSVNKNVILEYLKEGGCILTEADFADEILNINTRNYYVKFIYAKSDVVFNIESICDVYKNCLIPENANHLPNQTNHNTTLSTQIGKGKAIIFPSGLTSLLTNHTILRKNFYSEYAEKETNERVAAVSKGIIYHYVKNALEHLFHFRGLPFINLWQFPQGEKNIFLFRIDTDFGSPEQINELYKVCEDNSICASWFVETKSLEQQPVIFDEFNNQEIGLHCYRHRNFSSLQKNYENIKKGIAVLSKAGINPSGFAAPYGEWNEQLNKAVADSHFQYSSEFGYAYDCLPLFPYLDSKLSTVLQIPIHPMSIGRLKWGGHNEDSMVKYFFNIVDEKVSLQEPIVLYAHPGEEKFHLLGLIFQKINSYNIKSLTFKEFSDWWKERISFNWEAEYVNGEIKLRHEKRNHRIWVRISLPGEEVFLAPIDDVNERIKIEEARLTKDYNVSPNNLRKRTLRMIRHDILFRYRKLKQ